MALPPMAGGGGSGGGNVQIGIVVTVNTINAQRQFIQMQQTVNGLQNRMRGLDLQFRAIDRVLQYIAIGSLAAAAKGFLSLAGEMERLQLRMSIFEESFGAAGARLDQVVGIASNAPFKIQTLTDSFVKLKSAGLEPIVGANGEGPLKTLVDTVAAFGGSDEVFKRATIAIQQMAGKGVISMEELRQQLGEAVPNAIQLMAEGLGISVSKLITEVSRGNVEFERGITAFLDKAKEKYAGAADLLSNTFFGALNQVNSEITKFAINFNRAGGLDVFTAAIQMVRDALRGLNEQLTSETIRAGIESMFKALADNSDKIAAVVNVIADIGRVIGAVISTVTEIIPPEALTVGLIGYWFFGPAGAVVGALLSQFSGVIATFAETIAGFIQGTVSILEGIGVRYQEVAQFGLIGFILFGPMGLLIGAVIGVVDNLIGYLITKMGDVGAYFAGTIESIKYQAENLVSGFTDPEKFTQEANAAFEKAQQAFAANYKKTYVDPLQGGGPLAFFLDELKKLGTESATSGKEVSGFFDKLKNGWMKAAEGRQQYEGQFGQANAPLGLSPQQLQVVEKLGQLQQGLESRLASARGGGSDVLGYVASQEGKLRAVDKVISDLNVRIGELTASGNTQGAAQLKAELNDIVAGVGNFRAGLGELIAIENKKVFESFSNGLENLNARLEDIGAEATLDPIAQKVAQVDKQFTSMQVTLDKLRAETDKLKGSNELYAQATLKVDEAQARLNETWAQAIERAELLGRRQKENAAIALERTVGGFEFQAKMLEAQNMFDDSKARILQVEQQFTQLTQGIDDQIRQINENLQDGLIDPATADASIARLEAVKGKFGELEEAARLAATNAGQFWKDAGDIIGDSVTEGLAGVITGTQTWQEAATKMYNELTELAVKYILKLIMIKTLEAAGSAMGGGGGMGGGIFGSLFGGGFDTALAAKGMVVPGNVKMMAKGDLIKGPTLFGMAGEAGTEAIMPLTRGADGNLGVRSQGGGDKYEINIQAMDAMSVKQLFYRESGSLVQAIGHRSRMNRGNRTA